MKRKGDAGMRWVLPFALVLAVAACDESEGPPPSSQLAATSSPPADPPSSPEEGAAPSCKPYAPKDVCSSSTEVVVRDGCPFPACSCPNGCFAVEAYVIDANRCSKPAILGCLPSRGPVGTSTDGHCYMREEDGLIATAPSTISFGADRPAEGLSSFMPGWTSCPAQNADCSWNEPSRCQ